MKPTYRLANWTKCFSTKNKLHQSDPTRHRGATWRISHPAAFAWIYRKKHLVPIRFHRFLVTWLRHWKLERSSRLWDGLDVQPPLLAPCPPTAISCSHAAKSEATKRRWNTLPTLSCVRNARATTIAAEEATYNMKKTEGVCRRHFSSKNPSLRKHFVAQLQCRRH